jgi:hypothetical protein
VLRPAVEHAPPLFSFARRPPTELRGDHDAPPEWLERLSPQLLVRERAVDLGGIEEGDAAFDRCADRP